MKVNQEWLQENGLYRCPECGMEKPKYGICSHIILKHTEKGKERLKRREEDIRIGKYKPGFSKGVAPINKGKSNVELFGLEKAKEISEKISKRLIGKSKGIGATQEIEIERKRKISETMKKNPNAGGLREGSGRGIKTWYESSIAGNVYLRSSYELEYAKWLDQNNINWIANKTAFQYEWEGKIKKYYPDFYLIESKKYVEVKGFKTEKDEAKWKNFPFELSILYYNDLKNLGLNVKK